MAVSFRGQQVDIVSLAKKQEKTVALGNAHMNGRGDILGKGGEIVKTREEQLQEYHVNNMNITKEVNLKEESVQEVEKEMKKLQDDEITKPKVRKTPKYEDITEEELAELNKVSK